MYGESGVTNEITEDGLQAILEKSVKDELSGPAWPVYEHYEVTEEDGEEFVVAPFLEHWTIREQGNEREWSNLVIENEVADSYIPLRTPELLVDIAYLAEKGIAAGDVLRWAKKYGLLGLPEDDTVPLDMAGVPQPVSGWRRRDSVARFAVAAGEVMACLRAYEIVTKKEESLDLDALEGYLELLPAKALRPWERRAGEERRWWLDGIGHVVQDRLIAHCYPKLNHYRDGRFALSYGFKNLLGAIWLQMAWLLSAEDGVRRCKLRTCFKVITFEPGEQVPLEAPKGARGKPKTYGNKVFCDHNCAAKYSYRKLQGWPGYV
jgi:hypothetical protein